MWIDIFVNVS